ncbi:cation:proton antiporter [Roseivirga sp. UBA838]|uniref:cation:proton antiporter n=1 Tax=Roseivirga sp. UBA838 TaxID=1947393 RepID=UPI00257B88DF|nr:cation:proton antiporter [Roseivirga sp. UBA838]
MTDTIIIAFCSLLLIAYLFNLTASKTKIPSVILLLLMGWVLNKTTSFLEYELPDFSSLLPVIATVGLVLIVLEGSLELQLNSSKIRVIKKSFLGALISIVVLTLILSFTFQYVAGGSLKASILNAIPLCVISSAIAIPSIGSISKLNKEFIIYESSLSDILGVLLFNFIALNEDINIYSFGEFGIQLLIMIIISFAATLGLSWLLRKIDHHVKFIPIILLVVLIYSVAKTYHLPALIYVMIFGLSIGNIGQFKQVKWTQQLDTVALQNEIKKFKELIIEGAFLVRALFFTLFGYLLKTEEILNGETFRWAIGIVLLVFALRAIQLRVSKLPLNPLLFIAPRGLITVLLFISISPVNHISLVNNSLIIQVIILSALVMTFGLMMTGKKDEVISAMY